MGHGRLSAGRVCGCADVLDGQRRQAGLHEQRLPDVGDGADAGLGYARDVFRRKSCPSPRQVRPDVSVKIRPEQSRRCPLPRECPVNSSGGAVGESAGRAESCREQRLRAYSLPKARRRASSPAAPPTAPCPLPSSSVNESPAL
jgi:hypothetical protein